MVGSGFDYATIFPLENSRIKGSESGLPLSIVLVPSSPTRFCLEQFRSLSASSGQAGVGQVGCADAPALTAAVWSALFSATVVLLSTARGHDADSYRSPAFFNALTVERNRLASWKGGVWASAVNQAGWGVNTKEYDPAADIQYQS